MTASAAVHGARIVAIDDSAIVLRVIERSLAHAGFTRVQTFSDAHEAVEWCLANEPDLVLLDLHLPGVDDFEVLDRLVDGLTDVPVLVFSGYVTDSIRERAIAAGATDALEKSVVGSALATHIERVLLESTSG